jgi:lysyl-tRNA synthetase, class II
MPRKLATVPVALAAALAATGWLYLVQPGAVPGPRVGDALPLDELAHHSSTPLLWYVAVWAAAAAAIGAYARWARIERLTASLPLALGVGVFVYLATGTSIATVRQIPADTALDRASGLEAVYLPAAVVALACGALGRANATGRRAPFVVAGLVAAAGALDLVHTVLPGANKGLIHCLTPDATRPVARAAAAVAGLALVAAARGLARRRRRAWQLALAVAALSTILHVLHGLNDGSLASAVVLVVLVARRHDFNRPGDVATRRTALARMGLAATAIGAYGFLALWINRVVADQPFTTPFAAREILAGTVGLHASGSPHLGGSFGEWFPLSLLLLTALSTIWIVSAWIAPWRYRLRQEARERERARALVQEWGDDTLAPFALRADKSYFFDDDASAFLAYRVVAGVAIVSGDPVGPARSFPDLVARFIELARERDWRIAVLGASERWLALYREHGLNALYHGDEAVVEAATFSLEGRAIRKVRQSVHRLEASGYEARVLSPAAIDTPLRARLEEIAAEWRGDQPDRGFAMALDALFSLDDDEALFVVGFDADGEPAGFLHFAVAPAARALSLSSMPRLRSTPNGFNEWLICAAISWARDNGVERVSLNFAPFAAVLAADAELTALEEVQRRALLALKGRFQLDNLLNFNRKFFPSWERRFVVYECRRDLPRVALAALAAEAYLPFQGARR